MGFNRNAFPANTDGGFVYPIINVTPLNFIPYADGTAGQAGSCNVFSLPDSTRKNECVPNGRKVISVELTNNPESPVAWMGFRVDLSQIGPRQQFDAVRSILLDASCYPVGFGFPFAVGVYSEFTDFSILYTGSDSQVLLNVPALAQDSFVIFIQNYSPCDSSAIDLLGPFPFRVMFFNYNQEPISMPNGYSVCTG